LVINPEDSVNHRLPSGPAVIPAGPLTIETLYSVTAFVANTIFPILEPSVNHRLPSGPAVMPKQPGTLYSVISPVFGDILPMHFSLVSVNHRLPSGPAVIPSTSAV